MRRSKLIICGLLGLAPLSAMAKDPQFDATFAYIARDEIPNTNGIGKSDNDLAGLNAGLTWGAGGDGRIRAALEIGFGNNENWKGNYPANYGGELIFARKVGKQRYGLGARVLSLEDQTTSTEIGYSIEHLGDKIDLRGLAGVQILANENEVQGRDSSAFFLQGEMTLYPSDNLALSGGLLGDNDGEAYGVGAEYRPSGWGFSMFLEYSEAFDDYRGFASYDEFAGGIRFVPGTKNLKAQRQGNLSRLLQRYMQAQ